ncbi:MAG: 2-phospho-L-lactate guanylyltransferase [Deltaproteobacteria bacterium]|jgi:2-phospho-L-lactate guanylyltransferase|nr:2-phospho-L-lactate guanylyltransferase [Deltaproteobacteria bacterium]
MIGAVVPIKMLSASKSRMLPSLDRPAVEWLTIAMLGDVLEALQQVRGLDRLAVATPDPRLAEVAPRFGVELLSDSATGLNPAIEAACARIAPTPDDAALVVLGDVAGVQAADVEALLDAGTRSAVVLAPSSDGGTSALLRTPRNAISAAFGNDSANAHRTLATRAGVSFEQLALPSLAIDIDAYPDLEEFATGAYAGRRTRALLRDLWPEFAT